MVSINSLLSALDERVLAQRVSIPHDEARMRHTCRCNVTGRVKTGHRGAG